MDRVKLLTILFALLAVHHLEFAEAQDIRNNDIPACSGIFDFYFIIDRLAVAAGSPTQNFSYNCGLLLFVVSGEKSDDEIWSRS